MYKRQDYQGISLGGRRDFPDFAWEGDDAAEKDCEAEREAAF